MNEFEIADRFIKGTARKFHRMRQEINETRIGVFCVMSSIQENANEATTSPRTVNMRRICVKSKNSGYRIGSIALILVTHSWLLVLLMNLRFGSHMKFL